MSDIQGNQAGMPQAENIPGQPVLLLHGGANNSGHWRHVQQDFAAGFRPIAIDLHGSGRTGFLDTAGQFSLDYEAELAEAKVRHLGGRAHVVGHSYGGAVALRVAQRAQVDVRSLVLIEPMLPQLLRHMGETPLFEQMRASMLHFRELVRINGPHQGMAYFVDLFNGPGTWQGIAEDKRARLAAMAPGVVLGTQALADNPARPEELARITVPTSVLCGERTGAGERRIAELVATVIPGSRLRTIPGAAHMSLLTHPDLVRAALEEHLRAVAGAPPRFVGTSPAARR